MAGAGRGSPPTGPVAIQVITSRWTKASRGQPGASRRAAVPEVLPLRAPGRDLIVVETVVAVEEHGFDVMRSIEHAEALPVRVANVAVEAIDGAVRVTRKREAGMGWPRRERDVVACTLAAGQWTQVITNHRHSGYSGWSYDKIVVNVARPAPRAPDAFVGDPVRRLDEQESLFWRVPAVSRRAARSPGTDRRSRRGIPWRPSLRPPRRCIGR